MYDDISRNLSKSCIETAKFLLGFGIGLLVNFIFGLLHAADQLHHDLIIGMGQLAVNAAIIEHMKSHHLPEIGFFILGLLGGQVLLIKNFASRIQSRQ